MAEPIERRRGWFCCLQPGSTQPWHRCVLRRVVDEMDGWIVHEGPTTVVVQFEDDADRDRFWRGAWFRGVTTLPRPDRKLIVRLPYVFGRRCCDGDGALYIEVEED